MLKGNGWVPARKVKWPSWGAGRRAKVLWERDLTCSHARPSQTLSAQGVLVVMGEAGRGSAGY